MKFGDNLRSLRKLRKLSQEELAEKVNVTRQSVSKWETGDAYPEMSNILELCKILKCNINDLVNDSIIDSHLFDDDVKMNVVKFKREQQSKMKGLSRAIATIANIIKIIATVCIPIVIASMIIIAILIKNVEVNDDKITFKNMNDTILIEEKDDKINVRINDNLIIDSSREEIIKAKDILDNYSKTTLFIYLESGFAVVIVYLVLVRIMLDHTKKLFDNLYNGDTPFTLENVLHIKKMAYFMIALTLLPNVIGIIFEMVMQMDLNMGFELYSVIEILFLFCIAYIFQYGYEIQLDSKGKMYGDINE